MSPWRAWTAARHELYLAAEEQTVALHGRELFEARVGFYRAIDALFAGGNLGGVRITGRRPSRAELALTSGRRALSSASAATRVVQVVEGASGAADSAPMLSSTTAARPLAGADAAQPPFPATVSGHDSLQFHFFLPGLFTCCRGPCAAPKPFRACAS